MIITHKLEMDLAVKSETETIHVVQGDCNTRILELTLLSGGESWDVPEGAAVWMRYCKADGTKGIYDTLPDGSQAWSAAGNVLTISLAPQMLTAEGVVFAQAELVQGTISVATFTLQIQVERNPAAGVIVSEDYVNMLAWMETELDRLLAEARDSGEFDGPQGEQGIQGEPGLSVYEFALNAGYEGTEAELAQQLITPGLPLSGGTMSGSIAMAGNGITGLQDPVLNTDAATKAYVDRRRQLLVLSLSASVWSDTAPYVLKMGASSVLVSDWLRAEPVYTGVLETDLAIREAAHRISYVTAMNKSISFTCLETKPEIDLTMMVEVLR